ncbi:MAG: transposase [Rhodospirillaceae bacterium]|nr:transposase [Rhodospirillaceae bacterium]
MDETRAPVLDPGRGRTKTGWLWALARDDRAWGGPDPPGVVYFYAPGRGGEHAERFLDGFDGILQVDGYAGYNRLTGRTRKGGAPIRPAYCWSHARRRLREIYDSSGSEIAAEACAGSLSSTPSRPKYAAARPSSVSQNGRRGPHRWSRPVVSRISSIGARGFFPD